MRLLSVFACCIGALSASAQSTPDWQVTGYSDLYYQFDFGRPDASDTVNGRGFDIANRQVRIAVAQVDFLRAPSTKSPFGLNVQLFAGKNADLISLTEPGGKDKYKFVRQACVSYAPPGDRNGVEVDLGKFDTWIGYEGVDIRYQDEYSRSFNWTYSEPVYETGLRVTGRLSPQVTGGLFLVRGWNEVEDGNSALSVGAALSCALGPKTTVTLQNHYGDEGSEHANDAGTYGGIAFANPGTAKVHLLDLIITHQIDAKTKVAANVDSATSDGGANSGTWNGEALYVRTQVAPRHAVALRLERVEDKDGLRTGVPIQLYSLTASHEWTLDKHATLRFELRRDLASQPFFNDRDGTSSSRTTLALGAVFRF